MSDNQNPRKKYLLPIIYCGVAVMALWSATGVMSVMHPQDDSVYENLEPAAGTDVAPTPVTEADVATATELPPIPSDTKLDNVGEENADAAETPPLKISSDKPEIIKLKRDAVNVLVGSEDTLRAVPDTNRTIVLIPKKPGATYFRAMDSEGKVIMQRHVIVGSPDKGSKYIRIRRACAGDDTKCKEFSMYYCPDMCHEVNVVQGTAASNANSMAPDVAPSVTGNEQNSQSGEYVEPPIPTPAQ